MSFKNNDPELIALMNRPREPDDVDLVMLATAKVNQITPALTGAWCSMHEITQAVGRSPMAQRYFIFKAASCILMAAEQSYQVNTIAERAALNDRFCDDNFYINTVLVAALNKIKSSYSSATPT